MMNKNRYKLYKEAPSAEEFVNLRVKLGWGKTDVGLARVSLGNSLFHIVVRNETRLVGMGRVIGDGAMFYYIQDVAVEPIHQNQGIGNTIMVEIERYLKSIAITGSTIGLFAAKGKEGFYSRYGYSERSGDPLGKGMCKFV